VGVWYDDKVEIIYNSKESIDNSSFDSFNDPEGIIPYEKDLLSHEKFDNTLCNIKNLIGKRFSDLSKKDLKCPFHIESDSNNRVCILLNQNNEVKSYFPEQILAMILYKLQKIAEKHLGVDIKNAVVVVPPYFYNSQRQAVKDAGNISGLSLIRIMNETTAATLGYNFYRVNSPVKNILLIDIGAGTLKVSLISLEDGVIEVLANAGIELGGNDFDDKLIEYCAEDFFNKTGHNIRNDKNALAKLRFHCEKAKKTLSFSDQTNIEIDNLYETENYNLQLTRKKFNEICLELFKQIIHPIEEIFENYTAVSKLGVKEILFVGGSSRIPKIREIVKDFFNGKAPNCTLNPENLVVTGAAIQAAKFQNSQNPILQNTLIIDITPKTIGIETAGGVMNKLILRYSCTPMRKTQSFTTYTDSALNSKIQIYEGENELVKDNRLLGSYELTGIFPAPRGQVVIILTFDVNADGILDLYGVNSYKNREEKITIKSEDRVRLSGEEIERFAKEMKAKNREEK